MTTAQTLLIVLVELTNGINTLTTPYVITVVISVHTAVHVLQPLCAVLVTTMEAITIARVELTNLM